MKCNKILYLNEKEDGEWMESNTGEVICFDCGWRCERCSEGMLKEDATHCDGKKVEANGSVMSAGQCTANNAPTVTCPSNARSVRS